MPCGGSGCLTHTTFKQSPIWLVSPAQLELVAGSLLRRRVLGGAGSHHGARASKQAAQIAHGLAAPHHSRVHCTVLVEPGV
jgi:hypothetical protein